MTMKILVAVDLSEATPRVLQVTERVARQSSGEVRLLHVAEAEPDFIGYDAAGPDVVRDQVAKEFRDERCYPEMRYPRLQKPACRRRTGR